MNFSPVCKFKKNRGKSEIRRFFSETTKTMAVRPKKRLSDRIDKLTSLFYLTGNGIAWTCNVGSYCFSM